MRVPIRIANLQNQDQLTEVDAFVSRALTGLLLPVSMATSLGLISSSDVAYVKVEVLGRAGITSVGFIADTEAPFIGWLTLTALGLEFDSSGQRLVDTDIYLLAAR